ncbi:MAG: hypothetical protein AAGD14_06150 [Planctomycetota bacterium]
MHLLVAVVLLLFPQAEKAHTFAYKFNKDDQYKDTKTSEFVLEFRQGPSVVSFEVDTKEVMRRTVLEVKKGRPTIERVDVLDFTTNIKKHPEQNKIGEQKEKSVGGRYVWRRIGNVRWGLFSRREEVTIRHRAIVNRLKNWKDKRLPSKPIKVGDTWEVDILDYLALSDQQVPPGSKGTIEYKLKSVDDGIATIVFSGVWSYLEAEARTVVTQQGTWKFDLKRGRDLSIEATADLSMTGAREGAGRFKSKRVVEWKK